MDAERALITKIAQTGRGLNEMISDGITEHHFDSEENSEVWSFMVDHERKYGSMPSYGTIREEFPEFPWILSTDNIKFIRDRFLQARERRLAMEFTTELAHAVNDPERAGKLGEYILEAGRDIMLRQPGHTVHKFSDMSERIKTWHEQRTKGSHYGIRLGLPMIDAATLGIQPHEFVAIVGWQGMGKSTLSQWIVFNAYGQGKKTLYISLEMNAAALYRKWDSMALQFESYRNLKELNLGDDDIRRWEEYAAILKRPVDDRPEDMRGDILSLDDVRECTVEKVHAEINRHKPDLVVIDYLTLMEVPKMGGQQRWEKITWMSRQLKHMALTLKTPIIGLAQTDRTSAKDGAKLDNIGASYAIGADADVVLGLHQDDDMREKEMMEIRLIKNRDGELVNEKALWEMKKMRFVAPYSEGAFRRAQDRPDRLQAVRDQESEPEAQTEEQTVVPGEEATDAAQS
jgi:replicative DNA helicase